MRQRADWMKPADDAILEYTRDAGEVPPSVIARNVDIHPKYAGERSRELANYGLLDRSSDGYYSLTSIGEEYLEEQFNAQSLTKEEGQ